MGNGQMHKFHLSLQSPHEAIHLQAPARHTGSQAQCAAAQRRACAGGASGKAQTPNGKGAAKISSRHWTHAPLAKVSRGHDRPALTSQCGAGLPAAQRTQKTRDSARDIEACGADESAGRSQCATATPTSHDAYAYASHHDTSAPQWHRTGHLRRACARRASPSS